MRVHLWLLGVLLLLTSRLSASANGYYRQPAIHGSTIVFNAEGDLWTVPATGGSAMRLTTHPGEESNATISPDGQTLAYTASYDGPTEVYLMPLAGGIPTRLTYDAARARPAGWTADGKVIVSTDVHSTLPSSQLVIIDPKDRRRTLIPLAEAADGSFDPSGKSLFFTRLPFQGSYTKRYRGGTAQNIWRFSDGDAEAIPLTSDYPGTSRDPMWSNGRLFFITDRDRTMNIWSMSPSGSDLKQHTKHDGWDVASPALHDGRIAYQLGADLHLFDIASDKDARLAIRLHTDMDQMREKTVKEPMEYLSTVHISPSGDRVVLTARGQVFVVPHRQGRLVEVTRGSGVRYRDARFMPDGKKLIALSDQTGEVELWQLPANGVGSAEQLTKGGTVLRWDSAPSPDGKFIAHHDKDQRLFLFDVEKKSDRKIDENQLEDFGHLAWSPDSRWLAYVSMAQNQFSQIKLCEVATGTITPLTTDRYDSFSPAWSPDGKWLYFLSDRNLRSSVDSPWGSYQPEPFLDKRTELYLLPLTKATTRSPFAEKNELHADERTTEKETDEVKPETPPTQTPDTPARRPGRPRRSSSLAGEEVADEVQESAQTAPPTRPTTAPTQPSTRSSTRPTVSVRIDLDGIQRRLIKAPVAPGNYTELHVTDKSLLMLSRPTGERRRALVSVNIASENVEVKTITDDVRNYELSHDGKKLIVQKAAGLFILDAASPSSDLTRRNVDLTAWSLTIVPRDEWRQMFDEAWRLERDYFYDRGMHGVDWNALRQKYKPLVDRVTTRAELSDLIAQMVAELEALHIFVRGGDVRSGDESLQPSSLGASLVRDESAGGYRVDHIYESDPDEPEQASPLRKLDVNVQEGDIIESVNGIPTLSVSDIGLLLRKRANRQVLLTVKPKAGGQSRDVIVTPLSSSAAADLRYHEWEHTRRTTVDRKSDNQIGYVHLRAMGGGNFTEWAKGYYPAFTRQGLIVDVRHNRGGNIDSWIISRLLRKPWFFWSQRVGLAPKWNMQYAFRGHIVVLCNHSTMSDGEAFTEGVKRLKLGTVIGTRTWGGEIWLSSNNFLVDRGIATAAEFGVFGPEGEWLIEGHGVDPDIVVDNLPHATFKGKDAQLEAAIEHLQKQIKANPVPPVVVPKHPNKGLIKETAGGGRPDSENPLPKSNSKPD